MLLKTEKKEQLAEYECYCFEHFSLKKGKRYILFLARAQTELDFDLEFVYIFKTMTRPCDILIISDDVTPQTWPEKVIKISVQFWSI